jgi:hypothetical protein
MPSFACNGNTRADIRPRYANRALHPARSCPRLSVTSRKKGTPVRQLPYRALPLALALLAGACSSSASIGSAVITSDGRGAATIDTQTLTIGTQRPTDVPPPPGG